MDSIIKRLVVDMNAYSPFSYFNSESNTNSEQEDQIDYLSSIKKKSTLLLSQGLSRVGVMSTATIPTKAIKQD